MTSLLDHLPPIAPTGKRVKNAQILNRGKCFRYGTPASQQTVSPVDKYNCCIAVEPIYGGWLTDRNKEEMLPRITPDTGG